MIASGGAGLSDATFRAFEQRGLPIYQGYGLTETSPVVCSNRFGDGCQNDIGRPIDGVRLRIAEDGQLWVAGPNVMLGYWREGAIDHDATRAKIHDAWFATGDIATVDVNDRYRIVGRVDDRITLRSGYKVDPNELEQLILRESEAASAIVGLFHGELAAILEEGSETREAEVVSRLRLQLRNWPRYSRPKTVYLTNSFPIAMQQCRGAKGSWRRSEAFTVLEQKLDSFIAIELHR